MFSFLNLSCFTQYDLHGMLPLDEIGGNKEQPVEPADDGFNRDTILTASSAIQLLPQAPDKK